MVTRLQKNEEKLHQFTIGLDDIVFNTITSQILEMDQLPTITNAYTMIIKKERCRIVVRNKETRTLAVAFATQPTQKISIFYIFCTKS